MSRARVTWVYCAGLLSLGACAPSASSDDTGRTRAGTVDTAGASPSAPIDLKGSEARDVQVFFIELEGGRNSSEQIGCGDRVTGVAAGESVPDPLRFALQKLMDTRELRPAAGALYNALHDMSLRIDSIAMQDSHAIIGLSGRFSYGGVCDAPRIEAQLTRTATQFPTVSTASFFINGKPLRELLSER